MQIKWFKSDLRFKTVWRSRNLITFTEWTSAIQLTVMWLKGNWKVTEWHSYADLSVNIQLTELQRFILWLQLSMFFNHLTKLSPLSGILNFQIDCKQITNNFSLPFFKYIILYRRLQAWCVVIEMLCIWYILAKVTTTLFLQIYKYGNNILLHQSKKGLMAFLTKQKNNVTDIWRYSITSFEKYKA